MKKRTKSFVAPASSVSQVPQIQVSVNVYANQAQDREPVRLFLLGSRQGVNAIVHVLHHLRFAEVLEWSPVLDAPDMSKGFHVPPGEAMRVLTKYLPMV